MLCENSGPGIQCDEGGASLRNVAAEVAVRQGAVMGLAAAGQTRIMAKLSTDAGNKLRFGSDDGLLVTLDGDGPDNPDFCGKSIDTLATTGVTGAFLMAGLHHPFNSPYGLQYCIAHNIDITHVRTVATNDGVAWLAEYGSGNVTEDRSTIYLSNPASGLDSDLISTTQNKAGSANQPLPGKDGGWYGWLATKYQNWFLPELLDRANGKTIVLADCWAQHIEGAVVDEAANVKAVLRAGKTMCAQKRLMVGVEKVANAKTVVAEGFVPVMIPQFVKEAVKYGETKAPYTVDELTGAGVKWVAITEKYADSVFTAYRDAGISVLMVDSARQAVAARAAKVARGRLNMDPVYAAGVKPYDYRGGNDPWARKRMCLGQLTHNTDNYEVTSTAPRGYVSGANTASDAKNGLVIPSGFGDGRSCPSILVGYRGPVPKPDGTYTITWDMQCETLPTTSTAGPKIGLIFCAATDENTIGWEEKDDKRNPVRWPKANRKFYRAFWRTTSGAIGIGKWDESGNYTSKEVATAKPTVNGWVSFTLKVTPTSISFARDGSGGKTVTLDDDTWRGPYLFLEKEESHVGDAAFRFRAGFRNVRVK
jgi:hypothetical protein